jgi:hypothetical protein
MSRTIEVPDAVYAALEEAARANGTTAADWIAARLTPSGSDRQADDWLDRDFIKAYAHEADDSISLEAVRKAMSKIPGRLVDDIRAERDES